MSDNDLIRRGDARRAITLIPVFNLDNDELNAKAVQL